MINGVYVFRAFGAVHIFRERFDGEGFWKMKPVRGDACLYEVREDYNYIIIKEIEQMILGSDIERK